MRPHIPQQNQAAWPRWGPTRFRDPKCIQGLCLTVPRTALCFLERKGNAEENKYAVHPKKPFRWVEDAQHPFAFVSRQMHLHMPHPNAALMQESFFLQQPLPSAVMPSFS